MMPVRRILKITAASIGGLIVLAAIAGVIIVQTAWFRNFVRTKIIAAVETATGGKVDLASFQFDWTHLRAQVRGFTIHGLEPATEAPLFHANLVQVDLKLISPFEGFVDIAYLLVDASQANILVSADGRTNIPSPKIPAKSSNKTGLETIVDLSIGRFDLRNGSVHFGNQTSQFDAHGDKFRAQLGYNAVNPSYNGEIDISPLHLHNGGRAPIDIDVKLPVSAHKDSVALTNAIFTTARSHIVVSGTMDHLIDPRIAGRLNADISPIDLRTALGIEVPRELVADVAGSTSGGNFQVDRATVTLGKSTLRVSGTQKEAKFDAAVDLSELKIAPMLVKLDGRASIEPNRVSFPEVRAAALGGMFTGQAALEDMARYQLNGRLEGFTVDSIGRVFLHQALGYNGAISGPVTASGSLKDARALTAKASLAITPARGSGEVPVSGRINANYEARGDRVNLADSYIELPHTRANLSGQLGKQIQVNAVTHSFADLAPLAVIPVRLANNGSATVDATVSGSLSAPVIAGNASAANFIVEGRSFSSFRTAFTASPAGVAVSNAVVARGPLQMQLSASGSMLDWKLLPSSPIRADATIRNADVQDALALAETSQPITGAFSLDAHVAGTFGSPTGTVDASAANGTIEGEKYDSLQIHARMEPASITLTNLTLTAGAARLDANGVYQHPVNDLAQGSITAHASGNQIQLAQFQTLSKQRPGLAGTVTLTADGEVALHAGQIDIRTVNANAAAHGLAMEGKTLGDLTATAHSAGSTVQYDVSSNLAGSSIHVTGQSGLNAPHTTTATAAISNLPIERILALAGQRELPITGAFGFNGQVSGTLDQPQGQGTVTIANGSAYGQPITRLETDVTYGAQAINASRFQLQSGAASLNAELAFTHPLNDLEDGDVTFKINSNQFPVSVIGALKNAEPGISGTAQVTASGAARLRKNADPLFSSFDANIRANGLNVNQTPLGDLTLTANTRGNALDFNLNSNLAQAKIAGAGSIQLSGQYPANAKLSFTNVSYHNLAPLISSAPPPPFDASLEGAVTVSGPVSNIDALTGSLRLTKVEAHSTAAGGLGNKPRIAVNLANSGDVKAELNHGVVTVQNFKLEGRDANLVVSGSAPVDSKKPMALRIDGRLNLAILEAISPDIYSSGSVALNASVTGTLSDPSLNGRLQLQKASFNMLDLPNGISNANGTVAFTGSQAIVQSISGESGGGKVEVAGTAIYGGPQMRFNLQLTASRVHINYPDNITTQVSAKLTWAGTSNASLVTGRVSVLDVSLHSGADIGNVLTAAITPPSAPSGSEGPLAGLRFAVHIVTAPGVQFRTALTENIQANANLTLVGTIDNPGMLGRVTVTEGDVVFFGTKYTIGTGTVTFSNGNKIDPILNVDLETTVQGIDVALNVTGPADKMKLSYRSDPPLQFQEIVSLLASGTTPSSDPVIAAHAPVQQGQSLQQTGASALLGQAMGNPVSGRLQRLFGVSKLSINPQIVGATNTAQATLTLQQQVTRDITFTYIQDVTTSNPQIIRVEWAINPRYSATAERDVNGAVLVNLFYKRRFH
jgi:translocation and assembly module TamB